MSIDTITVRGAGIFGLSVAWALVRRGARVVIVDPHPHRAASRGIVGALAPHVPENWNEKKAFQFQSLVLAETLWAEIAEVSGQDPGYARTGRLQPLPDDAAVALARARAVSAQTLWQGRYLWQVIPDTGQPISAPTGLLVHDDLSALLHPRRATDALAQALRRLGVAFSDTPARGPQVWATGAAGLAAMGRGQGIKGQAALFACDMRGSPQVFADALHFVPHRDGTLAIGSTTERSYDDPHATDAQLEALIARARALLPRLADAPILERWAGLRPRAQSRAPLLGPDPTHPDSYIANGGFKIGFGMAPKVGAVMADLILNGQDRIPPGFHTLAQ